MYDNYNPNIKYQEIIDCLEIIKVFCATHENCVKCPLFGKNDVCLVTKRTPRHWDVLKAPRGEIRLMEED